MSDFKQQYKNPRPGFGHTDQNRVLRAYKHVESRREVRTRAFDNNRKLQDVSAPASPCPTEDTSITDTRMKKLIKWREERKKRKKLENATKKPVFKVGIVHHSLCSPVIRNSTSTAVASAKASKQSTQSNVVQKRITRATEKRLLAKATSSIKQSTATTKNVATTSTKYPTNIKKPTSNAKKQKSFAPANYEFRPPSGLHKMPLFGLVPIEQTPQEKGDFFIQNKSTECKTVYINEQKDISSQKLYAKSPDTSGTTAKFKISSLKLLPNKRKSSLRLNESICDVNDVTSKLNTITTTKLSLEEQTIQDSCQDKSSSDNTDMQTLSQKDTPSNTSSGKENCIMEDLIVFSPYLTLSRGKKNARKEQQQRLGIGPLNSSDEIPTKDTVMKNLNISVEEEERTAQYFKFLLNKETERLKELCRKWSDIKLEKDIPDDAMYEIQQAVGQTNLLISKKFERFRGLVEDCEIGKGEKLVTCRDLQGFWDMTYMEVRDCDSRFEKLEQRQNREWQEEESTVVKLAAKKRMPIKKQFISSKPSSLRSLIAAARKKKMEAEINNLMQDTNINMKHSTPFQNNRRSVNFDNNIQCNARKSKSPSLTYERKSTPVRRESSRTSLQKVQFSDKRIKTPLVTIKVSQMGKTPEVQLNDTISFINSDQTPGKSILKKSEELVDKESRVKSAHKVNFDDQIVLNKIPIDEELQTKLNLSAALSKIDNLDLDELSPQECINAERKLNFETEDSDNSDDMNEISEIQRFKKHSNKSKLSVQNTFDSNMHSFDDTTFSLSDKESPNDSEIIPLRKKLKHRNQHKNAENIIENILFATPIPTKNETSITSETISNMNDMTDIENNDLIRILRSRTITTNNISKSDRTSKMMTPRRSVSKKENKSPIESSRKSLSKLSQKDGNKYMTPTKSNTEIKNAILTENVDKKRRSSRKSVAFSAETCLACSDNKPVLPVTPHTKRNRSKTPLRQSRSKHAFDEDLILWNTPKHLPKRVTRSHSKN